MVSSCCMGICSTRLPLLILHISAIHILNERRSFTFYWAIQMASTTPMSTKDLEKGKAVDIFKANLCPSEIYEILDNINDPDELERLLGPPDYFTGDYSLHTPYVWGERNLIIDCFYYVISARPPVTIKPTFQDRLYEVFFFISFGWGLANVMIRFEKGLDVMENAMLASHLWLTMAWSSERGERSFGGHYAWLATRLWTLVAVLLGLCLLDPRRYGGYL